MRPQSLYDKELNVIFMSIHAATIMITSMAGKKKTMPKKGDIKPSKRKQK
jgi:hypothetical protein